MGGAMKMIKVPSLRLGILVTAVMVVFISGIHFAGSFRLAPSNHWTTSFTEVGPIHRVTSRYGFEISASSINTDGMTESTSNSRPWKVNRKMLLESSDTTSIRHSNESSNLSNKNIHKSSKEEILDSLFAQDTTMDAQSMATILEDETIVSRKEFACILKRLATCDPRYVSRVWGRAPVKWAYTRRLGNFLNQAELALEHQLHGDSAESMRKLNLVDSEEQRDFVISSLQNVLRSSSGMTVKALRGITVVCQIAGITKVNSSVTERILSLLDASISSLDMRALGKSMRIFIVDIWNWLSFNDTPWSNFPPSLQDKLLQLGDACAQDSKKVIITKHFASFRQYYKPTDTEKNHFKHWMEQYFDFNRLPTANTYPRMDRILLAIFETDALLTVQMYHTILNRYLGDLVGDHNLSAVVRDKDRYCNRLQAHFSNAASYKLLDQVTSLYRKCDNLTFVATSPFQVVDIYPRLDLLSYVTAVALSSPGFSSCNLKERTQVLRSLFVCNIDPMAPVGPHSLTLRGAIEDSLRTSLEQENLEIFVMVLFSMFRNASGIENFVRNLDPVLLRDARALWHRKATNADAYNELSNKSIIGRYTEAMGLLLSRGINPLHSNNKAIPLEEYLVTHTAKVAKFAAIVSLLHSRDLRGQ